jgi:NAD(P)-dependent dehydrogenase (short-subunit alcohol dehydrogenase family)
VARTYLITGASGIGAETARQLVRSCAVDSEVRLFVSSLAPDTCKSLVEELLSLGAAADCMAGDLTDAAFAPVLVAACIARFGRLDGLFNVAGISGRRFGDGPVHQCTEDGWAVTLETNLTTQYRMCREVVGIMRSQPIENGQRGVILNMSSILALHPEPTHFDMAAYAASKGAVLALSRTMAASYLKDKIRVNTVAPALVRTPMSARASEDETVLKFIREKQLLVEDVISVTDVARTCTYLLTEASHAVTGQCFQVDAGWGLV